MPCYTKHPEAESAAPTWQRCRDVIAGQDAIHAPARRETYLPKFRGESKEDYNARVARSEFFNATYRTIEGMVGMLFRKNPAVAVSPATEGMLSDVTQAGRSLVDLAKDVAREALGVGRVGLLVDYPQGSTEGMTVQQAEASGMRPKMALYKAENIINWQTGWVAGRTLVTRLVLEELAELVDPNDRFVTESVQQWRVLELVDVDGGKAVAVTVYRKPKNGGPEYAHVPTFLPLRNGRTLGEIPFVFIGADNTQPGVQLPPLIDLVHMNVSHYQSTSDVEHGAHKTAMPQPYVSGVPTGVDPTTGAQKAMTFYMGSGAVWMLPTGATAGMVEYSGTGLNAIETRIDKKEKQMAVLGARMLEQQKAQAETAETAGIHRSGEQSALATVADTIGEAIGRALAWFDEWAGGTGKVEFAINKDFIPRVLDAQQLAALVAAWQAGGLSDRELFAVLQVGGIINEAQDFETHDAEVRESRPASALPAPIPASTGAEA
ncbi:DUF4055 domain-containing protein [Massilia sp. METH4]|uniref:DUF4055 domain-containing protein n=1 Tax=Massilia sp. METH4 TaxID=3123041 RepID=UPI0030D248E0